MAASVSKNMAFTFLNYFSRQFHPPRGEHIVRHGIDDFRSHSTSGELD